MPKHLCAPVAAAALLLLLALSEAGGVGAEPIRIVHNKKSQKVDISFTHHLCSEAIEPFLHAFYKTAKTKPVFPAILVNGICCDNTPTATTTPQFEAQFVATSTVPPDFHLRTKPCPPTATGTTKAHESGPAAAHPHDDHRDAHPVALTPSNHPSPVSPTPGASHTFPSTGSPSNSKGKGTVTSNKPARPHLSPLASPASPGPHDQAALKVDPSAPLTPVDEPSVAQEMGFTQAQELAWQTSLHIEGSLSKEPSSGFFSASGPSSPPLSPNHHSPRTSPRAPDATYRSVCLLMHGLGQSPKNSKTFKIVAPEALTTSGQKWWQYLSDDYAKMAGYWGTLPPFLLKNGACDEVHVHHANTNDHAWDDDAIMEEYCSVVRATKATVVYTHSMGNLIIAAGIYYNAKGCAGLFADPPTDDTAAATAAPAAVRPPRTRPPAGAGARHEGYTAWIGSQGPLRGAISASMCVEVCKKNYGSLSQGIPVGEFEEPSTPTRSAEPTHAPFGAGGLGGFVAASSALAGFNHALNTVFKAAAVNLFHLGQSLTYTAQNLRSFAAELNCDCSKGQTTKGTVSLSHFYTPPHATKAGRPALQFNKEPLYRPPEHPVPYVEHVAAKYMWGDICGFFPYPPLEILKKVNLAPALGLHLVLPKLWPSIQPPPDISAQDFMYGLTPQSVDEICARRRRRFGQAATWGTRPDAVTGELITGHDLLVPFYSCSALGMNKFSLNPQNPFYAMPGNHKTGIGYREDDTKPWHDAASDVFNTDTEHVRQWLLQRIRHVSEVQEGWFKRHLFAFQH